MGNKEDPQSWNLYAYVRNNPVISIDPMGLNWFYVNDQWEWHKGSSYTVKDSEGNKQTYNSEYTHLMVVVYPAIGNSPFRPSEKGPP